MRNVRKFGGAKAAPAPKWKQDWDWVADIKDPKDITPELRRRAAGLVDGPVCPLPTVRWASRRPSTNGAGSSRGSSKQNGVMDVDDDAGEGSSTTSIVLPNSSGPACTAKRCKSSPRCYNNLGFEKWAEKDAKEKYVENNAGEELVFREGPAGLCNYGATCYANAFLQLWFNNVAFRNGVYEAAGEQGTLHCLASVFGSLQLSRRPVVDPGPLIEALRLNKGDQQDAAEFSKLFMTLLSDEFTRRNPEGNLVKDLFEGEMEYCTRCDTCGYESKTSSPFLELEINLKDKASLESRIDHLLQSERLDGDNKYSCPRCGYKLQPATRSTALKKLPPFLHFSLMRFVYDPRQDSRKKTKHSIVYPRKLQLSNTWYELVGVVTHEGASAFHGHFTCEVYDEQSKEFYFYSDELVQRVADGEGRPKKRIKLETDDGTESSRDAYMLVYRKMGGPLAVSQDPPPAVVEAIEADNTALASEINGRMNKNSELADQFDSVQAEKLAVLSEIEGDDCLIPRDDLKTWVESPELATAWKGFEDVMCEHNQVDPGKTKDLRLVSRSAFDRIKQMNPDIPEVDVCSTCVEAEFTRRSQKSNRDEQVKAFNELNTSSSDTDYLLSKDWLKEWRGKSGIDVPPTDPDYDLRCEHGLLYVPNMNQVARVTPEAVALLRSIFGDFPIFTENDPQCDACAVSDAQKQSDYNDWRARAADEKKLAKNQLNITQILDTTNYLLPKKFFAEWEAWMRGKGAERPEELAMEYCPHGLLDFDPQMEHSNYITAAGWQELCTLYNHHPSDAVTVTFTASPPTGKKCSVDRVSKATCKECQHARLLDFDKMWLPIVQGKDAVPVENLNKRRATARSKQIWVEVEKDTAIKDIRLHILETWKVSPLSQRLFLRGSEVEASDTVESLGIAEGDFLCFEEIEEADDFGPDGRAEGFGGTALIGRTACPACTYSNEPMHLQCAMCETLL